MSRTKRYYCGCVQSLTADARDLPGKKHFRWALTRGFNVELAEQVHALFHGTIFPAWSNICGVTFEPAASNKRYDLEIFIGYIDGPGGTLAQATLPGPDVQTQEYDLTKDWTLRPGRKGLVPWSTVGIHETGHTMGLWHDEAVPRGQKAIMAPFLDTTIDRPQPRDVARAVALFGPPKNPEPSPTEPGLLRVEVAYPQGVEISLKRV